MVDKSFRHPNEYLFGGFSLILLLSLFAAVATDEWFFVGIPILCLFAYVAILDFRKLYYLLFFCIPLSTEISLPGGLSTDLPTEPLILGLMGIYILHVISNGKKMSSEFIRHPISLLILLHLGWIFITTIPSNNFIVSLKFSVAKIWYIVVFYFMAGSLLKKDNDYKKIFWSVFIPLALIIIIVNIRHAGYGFSFKDINRVLNPFFRNHVAYATLMALFFPVLFLATRWYDRWSKKWLAIIAGIGLFLIGIQFSYTRAAYIGLFMAAGVYFIIQFKLMKPVLITALITLIAGVGYITSNNKYLDYAPDFDRTVTHQKFDNLIEATYKMEDISTMERLYRWVAGSFMFIDEPWMGFGPGNFYNFYKSYTISSFKTYVSDNPEKSGIHSYYLMTLVEQGIFGFLIFIWLNFYVFLKGEKIYHQSKSANRKTIVMMCILSLIVMDALLLINDMIETDKLGSFYFMNIAVLVNMDLANKREKSEF